MAGPPRRVIWSPKSRQDLRDIWRHYERIASAETAEKLLREIGERAEQLADEALMWRARDEILPGLRSRLVHPYTVFYRLRDDTIEIVRVLHERRDFARAFSKREA